MKNQEYTTPVDQFVIDFIKELRNRKKLSQKDIGDVIGVSRSYARDIESPNSAARYTIRHLNMLAEHFGLSPKAFMPEKALPLAFPGKLAFEEVKEKRAKKVKGKKVVKKVTKKK